MTTAAEIVAALEGSKNVLLHGPPGTGKTWLVSEVVAQLTNSTAAGGTPTLVTGATAQFGTSAANSVAHLPANMDVEWVTFHQSYSYEEFIMGRRPVPQSGGLILEPFFGLLMTIAVRLKASGPNHGCLLIIDELNRANTGQVFGEFITFLDPEYRETVGGSANNKALKIRLPGVAYENGESEEIRMLRGGGTVRLPEDWTFPEHIYVLATMNSVDKAALPLDSALTRRFHRIEMQPRPDLLAQRLGVDLAALATKVHEIRIEQLDVGELDAAETAVLLLDKLNSMIAGDMGDDFELGHSFLWGVTAVPGNDRWRALIRAWDRAIYPQLVERFAGRTEALKDVLKVSPGSETSAAFHERYPIGSVEPVEGTLAVRPLLTLPENEAANVLRHLVI